MIFLFHLIIFQLNELLLSLTHLLIIQNKNKKRKNNIFFSKINFFVKIAYVLHSCFMSTYFSITTILYIQQLSSIHPLIHTPPIALFACREFNNFSRYYLFYNKPHTFMYAKQVGFKKNGRVDK